MNAEAVVVVSGAVVALTQLAKWGGLKDGHGIFAVVAFSAIGVALWGFSQPAQFDRTQTFQYFTGWLAVATSAAGVFGFTRASSQTLTQFKGSGGA